MFRTTARALLAFSLISVTGFAQTPPPAAPAEQPGADNTAPPFTLEEAIAMALQKNFDLQIQAYSVDTAKDNIAIQEGAFDPTINAAAVRSLS